MSKERKSNKEGKKKALLSLREKSEEGEKRREIQERQ